jgi:hypothetical protein
MSAVAVATRVLVDPRDPEDGNRRREPPSALRRLNQMSHGSNGATAAALAVARAQGLHWQEPSPGSPRRC